MLAEITKSIKLLLFWPIKKVIVGWKVSSLVPSALHAAQQLPAPTKTIFSEHIHKKNWQLESSEKDLLEARHAAEVMEQPDDDWNEHGSFLSLRNKPLRQNVIVEKPQRPPTPPDCYLLEEFALPDNRAELPADIRYSPSRVYRDDAETLLFEWEKGCRQSAGTIVEQRLSPYRTQLEEISIRGQECLTELQEQNHLYSDKMGKYLEVEERKRCVFISWNQWMLDI